jgi:hypothetical protein
VSTEPAAAHQDILLAEVVDGGLQLFALGDATDLLGEYLVTTRRLQVATLGLEPGNLIERRCPRVAD